MADLVLFSASEVVRNTIDAVLGRWHAIDAREELTPASEAELVIADLSEQEIGQSDVLETLGSAVRLLLIVDRTTPVPTSVREGRRLAVLRKPFDPFELRLKVDALLATPPSRTRGGRIHAARDDADMWLEFPYVPAPAGALLRRAAALDAPLWIMGEPGCGRRRVAAAVSLRHDPTYRFVTWYPDQSLEQVLETAAGESRYTLYVPDIDGRSIADQERLLAAVSDNGRFRLVVSSVYDPAAQAASGGFSRGLYHALTGLVVQLSPLRERPEAIAPLARMLTFSAARRLGYRDATYSEEGLARLRSYMWPGNLAELEAVINRTIVHIDRLGSDSLIIEADEVRLVADDPGGNDPREPVQRKGVSQEEASPQERFRRLFSAGLVSAQPEQQPRSEPSAEIDAEVLIASLAHEFGNPMVPIQTLASMLNQGESSEEEARILINAAGDACDRIGNTIKTLSAFASLETPTPSRIDLADLIRRGIELNSGNNDTPVRLLVDGPLAVVADPTHVEFAIGTLLDESFAELARAGTIEIRPTGDGTIEWMVSAGPTAVTHLGKWIGRGDRQMPWRVMLVRAVTMRNGGSLEMETAGSGTTFALTLPVKEGGGAHGKKTNRTHR